MNSKLLPQGRDYAVYDNWLSPEDKDEIYNVFFNLHFPWFWARLPYNKDGKMYTCFESHTETMNHMKDKGMVNGWQLTHTFIRWDKEKTGDNGSPFPNLPYFIFDKIGQRFNIPGFDIYRVKANLKPQIIGANLNNFDTPHVDSYDECLVMIYYVHDSDGDTFVFDKDMNIMDSISPKKGRMLVMKSGVNHAAGYPVKNQNRVVINFNFKENYSPEAATKPIIPND